MVNKQYNTIQISAEICISTSSVCNTQWSASRVYVSWQLSRDHETDTHIVLNVIAVSLFCTSSDFVGFFSHLYVIPVVKSAITV